MMCNAKVKSAVAEQGCRKVIPVYPVRYAVMPSEKSGYSYPTPADNKKASTFNFQMFPELNSTSYCLRNLRPNGYVYIYDTEAPTDKQWSCYYYHSGKRGLGFYKVYLDASTKEFFYISKTERSEETTACASKFYHYLPVEIHEHQPKIVYMGYSHVPYTAKIISGVEDGSLKTKIMQGIDLGKWIDASKTEWEKTKKPLIKAPSVAHTTLVSDLHSWNIDFHDEQHLNHNFVGPKISNSWSEEVSTGSLPLNAIESEMSAANMEIKCAVALYDGIGIASELSHLVGFSVNEFNRFNKEDTRKKWVSDAIESLIKEKGNAAAKYVRDHSVTYRARAATKNDYDLAKSARISTIAYYFEKCRNQERLQYLKERISIREACFKEIELAGDAHLTWLKYDGVGCLHDAFVVYDFTDVFSFIGFRGAFTRCIDACVATPAGLKYANRFLPASGPIGWFYYALKGHEILRTYIDESKEPVESSAKLSEEEGIITAELLETFEELEELVANHPAGLVAELSNAIASITSTDDLFSLLVDEKQLNALKETNIITQRLRNELIDASKIENRARLTFIFRKIDKLTPLKYAKLRALRVLNDIRLDKLSKAIKLIPSDNAARALAVLTSSILSQGGEFTHHLALMKTDYPRILEALEREIITEKTRDLKKLPAAIRKALMGEADRAHIQPTKKQVRNILGSQHYKVRKRILRKFYVSESLNVDFAYQEQLKEIEQARKGIHFWNNVKIGLSGIAILATSNAVIDGLTQFNDENADLTLNSLSAINGGFGLTSSGTAIRQFQLEHRAALATTKTGEKNLMNRALKIERLSLYTLAGAAAVAGWKNIIRGNRAGDTTIENLYYFAASLQFSAAALAAADAVSKLEAKIVKKAVSQVSAWRLSKAVVRLNFPITLALFLLEGTAYLIEQTVAKLEAKKVGLWIENSTWGVNQKAEWKRDFKKEQYALKKLFLSPVVTTDFNQVKTFFGPVRDLMHKFSFDQLNPNYKPTPTLSTQISIFLPAYHPDFSHYLITKGGDDVTKQGRFEQTGKIATVHYDELNWFGDLEVQYWPDAKTAPDIFYTYP